MSAVEFEPWPKIARLNRSVLITEKIDGTNAAVLIVPVEPGMSGVNVTAAARHDGRDFLLFAQSRTRFITPGKATDNFGFAGWVSRNAEALVATLGEGRHFGEWWGPGIQRGYGLIAKDQPEGGRRFSLFNAGRWGDVDLSAVPSLRVVPNLSRELRVGRLEDVPRVVEHLREFGSYAEPGFMRPEGIIIWHTAERTSFKVTLEGDEAPKSLAAAA